MELQIRARNSRLIFGLALLSTALLGQEPNTMFEVLHYRDSVINQTTNKLLKKGNQYLTSDQLLFTKNTCRLAVLNDEKNMFIVSPVWKDGQLKASYRVLPFSKRGRDGIINSSIELVNHIGENEDYLVIGGECEIEISPNFFRMNQDSFFYIRYYWQQDTIDKKLPFVDNRIILSKDSLLQVKYFEEERYGKDTLIHIPEGEAYGFEFRCYGGNPYRVFFDPSLPDHLQNRSFISIRLKFLDSTALQKDITFLLQSLDHSKNKVLDRVHAFLEGEYSGKINKQNLSGWMKEKLDF